MSSNSSSSIPTGFTESAVHYWDSGDGPPVQIFRETAIVLSAIGRLNARITQLEMLVKDRVND